MHGISKEEVKIIEKEIEEKEEETKTNYEDMKLSELKVIAKEQGVKGYSSMKKDEILKSIK